MATKQAHKRLTREYKHIQENPTPFVEAHPNENHILEWHYLITGPPDTPYEGGQYHGTLVFPSDYPFKPPAIRMITPSGRFKTNTRLCLSISDYHPKSWNPAWSVSTILTGLLSFMVSDETTAGSTTTSDDQKKEFAKKSHKWNLYNNSHFLEHFPENAEENKRLLDPKSNNNTEASVASQSHNNNAKNEEELQQKQNPTETNNTNAAGGGGLSTTQKAVCVCLIFLSWILASRLLGDVKL